MNSSVFRISLDVHEIHSQVSLHMKKGDSARKLLFTLTEGGRPYEITGDCTAVFTARKEDGSILYNACAVENNTIVYALTAQTTSAAGKVHCELRLYGADAALITSPRFLILVDDTVYSDGDVISSAGEFSQLTALLTETGELMEACQALLERGKLAAWVTFEIDGKGDLYVINGDGFEGAEFSLTENGELEVVTHE